MKIIDIAYSYDFNDEHELVQYIYESYVNGNRSQAIDLYSQVHLCVDYERFNEIIIQLLTADQLDKFLDYPTKDPHGDPIPNTAGFIKYSNRALLSDLAIGEKGKFIGVKDSSSEFLKFLDKRKIALGTNIQILHIEDFDNSIHIGLDETNLTISVKSANNIYVSKI